MSSWVPMGRLDQQKWQWGPGSPPLPVHLLVGQAGTLIGILY